MLARVVAGPLTRRRGLRRLPASQGRRPRGAELAGAVGKALRAQGAGARTRSARGAGAAPVLLGVHHRERWHPRLRAGARYRRHFRSRPGVDGLSADSAPSARPDRRPGAVGLARAILPSRGLAPSRGSRRRGTSPLLVARTCGARVRCRAADQHPSTPMASENEDDLKPSGLGAAPVSASSGRASPASGGKCSCRLCSSPGGSGFAATG
jgi:hypothetical protein